MGYALIVYGVALVFFIHLFGWWAIAALFLFWVLIGVMATS